MCPAVSDQALLARARKAWQKPAANTLKTSVVKGCISLFRRLQALALLLGISHGRIFAGLVLAAWRLCSWTRWPWSSRHLSTMKPRSGILGYLTHKARKRALLKSCSVGRTGPATLMHSSDCLSLTCTQHSAHCVTIFLTSLQMKNLASFPYQPASLSFVFTHPAASGVRPLHLAPHTHKPTQSSP